MHKASVCTLDCPDTCSLSVQVEDGQITAVRGSRANPFTGGAICRKVARSVPEFVHGETRLRTPLCRRGPRGGDDFEAIGWDDALGLVRAGFEAAIARHGPLSVMPFNYAGPHGLLARDAMSARFFHRLGATRLDRPPLCGGIQSRAYASLYGDAASLPPEAVEHADLILVWGNNVTVSNLHLARLISAARRRGARLAVIDPRRVAIARKADAWIAPLPGSDCALALALVADLERRGALDPAFMRAHCLGHEAFLDLARRYPPEAAAALCGLQAEEIRTLAAWYAAAERPVIVFGNGPERNANGGAGIRAACALPAVTGKYAQPGQGLMMGASVSFPVHAGRLQRPDLAPAGTRCFNIVDVADKLLDPALDPPVAAVFIYNHNPLVVHPDQNRMRRALSRDDLFIAGADVAFTDSLRYADVVLPMSTSFEHADLYPAYGHNYLQRAEAVIAPVGESLPPTEIFRRLAARFGFDSPEFLASDEQLMREALAGAEPPAPGAAIGVFDPAAHPAPSTLPSGRIELSSAELEAEFGCALPQYRPPVSRFPLRLISPASDQRISSTFGGLAASAEAPPLEMHPHDAAARGLGDGARVRVWNDLGEVRLRLRLTDTLRPGVVCSEKGAWCRTSDNGQTVSALAPGGRADLGGACYNDARVEVSALA